MLDSLIQSAPRIDDAIYGGDAIITGRFKEKEARGLASVLENPLQTPVSVKKNAASPPPSDTIRSGRALLPAWSAWR